MPSRGIIEWSYIVERRLATMMSDGLLPREWLRDWWAPHHLRFGASLGYPGVAVCSNLWLDTWNRENGHEEPAHLVTVGRAVPYEARVGFYVVSAAKDAAEIIELSGWWNQVIYEVSSQFPEARVSSHFKVVAERQSLADLESPA